jgi:type I restriction enzyme S subunit
MSDWKDTTLGEILELITDYHSNGSYETLKENVELLDQKDFAIMIRTTNFEQNSFSENLKYISEHSYYFLKKSMVYPGDIIMNKIANAGSVYFMPNLNYPVSLAMNLFLIRINKEKANQRFIFYYLKVNESYIKQFAEGSVTKTITKNAVKNLIIKKPCIETQNKIVKVIESLENKIENLRRQNETLEQIAQTLFKHWFIDFEFPNADGKPYKSSGGAMSPSELGDIPEGWRVGKLGDVVNVNSKSMNKNYPHQIIEYVDISSVGIGTLENTTQYKLSEAPSRARRLVQHGDVIWSGVRPNRKSYLFICKPIKNLVVSTGFIVLSPKKIPSSYLYAWVTTSMFVDYLTLNASGSAYPAVKAEHFEIAEIVLPSKSLLEKFHLVIDPMRVKTHENSLQIQTLTKTRDALLPKLMSGQLRVKE